MHRTIRIERVKQKIKKKYLKIYCNKIIIKKKKQ